jgi:hypothetical protein
MVCLLTRWSLLLVCLLGLAGCETPLPSLSQAQQALCEPLVQFRTSISEFTEVSAETTAGELREWQGRLDGAVETLRTANVAFGQAAIDELVTAYDELAAAIADLPDQAAIGEAQVQIEAAMDKVQTAYDQALAGLNCTE